VLFKGIEIMAVMKKEAICATLQINIDASL
jgi:hypothetical protein